MTVRHPTGGRGSNQYVTKGQSSVPGQPLDPRQIAEAVAADTAAEDVAWVFHPDRELWQARGFDSAPDARLWAAAGVDIDTAAKWHNAGVGTPGEALQWGIHHYGVVAAQTMIEDGCTTPGEANERAREVGFQSMWHAEHQYWAEHSLTPRQAWDWKEAGAVTPNEAWDWIEVSVIPEHAAPWIRYQFTADDYRYWSRIGGITAPDAARWRTVATSSMDDYEHQSISEIVNWVKGRIAAGEAPADIDYGSGQ